MRHMEGSLSKANRAIPDCSAAKLHAMNGNTVEQVCSRQHEVTHLRELSNENKIHLPDLYHYTAFSDDVLACAVVVNSTNSTAKEPEKLVFHSD
ncbi:hypothetical protein KIW84_051640 [Lathyrus oleraceus]|uniref:Uncharacterized protein n=1 Tax=Pisum sativum TaxID=3888 RepID=A0A9D5ADZ5_PEA|nr:hypothetical protein KIW84_051640 [Pisum sativum]